MKSNYAILNFLIIWLLLTGCNPFSINNESMDQRAFEIGMIFDGKEKVKTVLKDPGSATFQNVFFNDSEEAGAWACGEVNSKNAFGGYTGFKRFVANKDIVFLDEDSPSFSEVWSLTCIKKLNFD